MLDGRQSPQPPLSWRATLLTRWRSRSPPLPRSRSPPPPRGHRRRPALRWRRRRRGRRLAPRPSVPRGCRLRPERLLPPSRTPHASRCSRAWSPGVRWRADIRPPLRPPRAGRAGAGCSQASKRSLCSKASRSAGVSASGHSATVGCRLPVGCWLAAELRRADIDVVVLEKRACAICIRRRSPSCRERWSCSRER